MNKSIMIGLATAMFAVGMGFSTPAYANLGTCGPANEGEVKTIAYYYSNGRISRYYEYTCYQSNWEMTAFWHCDSRGYCINLS